MFRFDEVPASTTPAVLATVAEAHPDRPFVVGEDGTLTYGEGAVLVAQTAARLAELGHAPGDRVGILLTNGVRWVLTYLAAHAAGLTVVPLSTWYRGDELSAVAKRADLRLIVTQDELFGQPSVAEQTAVPVLTWNPGTDLCGLPQVADAVSALHASPVRPADDALVLFTSGSSAEPKAVRLTQEGVVRTAYAIGERQGVVADDRFWFGSPLFFVYGCSNALPNAMTHAATLCVQERFEPAGALEFIERHRCTVYYGVAPITRALASCPDLAKRDISSLRIGTGNATPDDLRLAIDVLGVTGICNAYGLTEGHGHSTITDHTDPPELRMHTQGTVLPTQELRIVANGEPVGPGVPGEIQIRGLITPGYLDDDGSTAQGFTESEDGPGSEDIGCGGGWFRTGDLGKLDAQGRLTYLGRNHELLKVNGINVSPLEIERVLVEHEHVDEAFVFGVPTPEGDEIVAGVLVPAADAPDDLADDVLTWLRARIASYKVPDSIRVMAADQLPLTATGKVSKRLMRDSLISGGCG